MILSPRLSNLLLILAKYDGYITINELASQINTSKRTVSRELENINKILSKYNLELEKKTGLGIRLNGSNEDKQKFISTLNNVNEVDITDKKARRKRLILELLKDTQPKKLYYYSNMFGVSETTISNDMEKISPWFEKHNLKLIKKQGYGVYIEANEKDYRKAITKFINENIEDSSLIEVFKNSDRKIEIDKFMLLNNKDSIYNLINKDILNKVILAIKSISDKKISSMTESSYIGLIIHLSIAIDRILKYEKIGIDCELEQKLKNDEDYKISEKIAKSLEEEFQIKIPAPEISYICIHIKGAKLQYIDKAQATEDFIIDNYDLTNLIFKMIDKYDSSIADELKADIELIEGLVVHLQPTLIRLKYKLEIVNPLLNQIKSEYPSIFENSKKASSVISDKYGYDIPEDEIGFLAMHFGASVLRLNNRKINIRTVNIAVVCASGIGVSFLISSKLKNVFKDKITVATYSKDEINQNILDSIDILVSTFDLDYMTDKSITINPLLLEKDLNEIQKQIDYYSRTEKDYKKETNDFLEQLEDIKPVANDIAFITNNFTISYIDENITFEDLVKEVSFKFDKHQIIYNDLMAREKIATQVIKEFNFVLLHSRTYGVDEPIFRAVLPKAENFTNEYFKLAQVVIVMLVPKNSNRQQIEIMGSLSSALVEDEDFLNSIKKADQDKVKFYIKSKLKKYFMNYLEEFY